MNDRAYPELENQNITELDLKLAGYYFPILVEVASERTTITYGNLLHEARRRHPEYFDAVEGEQRETDFSTGRRLGTIWRFTDKQGFPIISTLVVNADTGECGDGVPDDIDLEAERKRVYDFDWNSVSDNFLAHQSYEREVDRRNKSQKPKKRSSKEAAHALGQYWTETRDGWPQDLAAHRDELQAEIEKGLDPATVFSGWVLKRPAKKSAPVYVYLAEYRNAMTGGRIGDFQQVKIGCTSDLVSRARALSGGVKSPVEVVITQAWRVTTGNAFAVEQRLHGHFREHQVVGEWFNGLDGALTVLVQEQLDSDSLTRDIADRIDLELTQEPTSRM